MKIISVVGARPNFMKIAPILRELRKYPSFQSVLVHTGQHYDANMSDVFFRDLQIPEPDIFLNVGSGSHAKQTADIMTGFEQVLLKEESDVEALGSRLFKRLLFHRRRRHFVHRRDHFRLRLLRRSIARHLRLRTG